MTNRYMRASVAGIIIVGLCGCTTPRTQSSRDNTASADQAAKSDKTPSDDGDSKRQSTERKLEVAEASLAKARMDAEAQATSSANSIRYAERELSMAQGKLKEYTDLTVPNRVARKRLELQRAQDSATEAAEELKQIELMYKDQDLADMTAEFVINRGKRNADRRQKSLQITERELLALTEHELPRETNKLTLDVSKKEDALAKARRDAESGALQSRISVMTAETKVIDLRDELAKMDEEDAK